MKISIKRMKQIIREELASEPEKDLLPDIELVSVKMDQSGTSKYIEDVVNLPTEFRQLIRKIVDLSQVDPKLELLILRQFVRALEEEAATEAAAFEVPELEEMEPEIEELELEPEE